MVRRCSRRWGQERFPISRPRCNGRSRAGRPRHRTWTSTERTTKSMTASENGWWPRALSLTWVSLFATQLSAQTPDYQNPDLAFERRVADLVSRMTLEEKISQLQNVAAPAPAAPIVLSQSRREMGSMIWPFLTRGPRRVLSPRNGRSRLGHHRIVFRPVAHRGLVGRAAQQGHA